MRYGSNSRHFCMEFPIKLHNLISPFRIRAEIVSRRGMKPEIQCVRSLSSTQDSHNREKPRNNCMLCYFGWTSGTVCIGRVDSSQATSGLRSCCNWSVNVQHLTCLLALTRPSTASRYFVSNAGWRVSNPRMKCNIKLPVICECLFFFFRVFWPLTGISY